MKTFLSVSLLFLFTHSTEAQSHKSGLTKTVDAINSMLHPNKMVRFTNQDYARFYPTKINANLQGDVFCIESSTSFGPESNGIMFNLLSVKSFVIKENEILALRQDHEPIVAIFLGNSPERQVLKKELDALLFICISYSKLDSKFKCD